jgi:two-component sensor histidine kinase
MRSTVVEKMPYFIHEGATMAFDPGAGYTSADASLGLLVCELQHRIRNLLTVVQCLVNQTEAATADGYRAALNERIATLSDAYSLIECAGERHISLTELLARTLRPYAVVRKDRIYVAGPDVELEPRLALSLHMIFHELATNASKHGALSTGSGRVEVLWDFLSDGADRRLAVQWSERGGPQACSPKRKGFGLRFIERVLTDAQVEMDFDPAGFVCRFLVGADQA